MLLTALALLLTPVSRFLAPSPLSRVGDAAAGLLLALGAVGLQRILSRQASCTLAGGFLGGILGALAARLLASLAPGQVWGSAGASFFPLLAVGLIYVGATVGARMGSGLSLSSLRDAWQGTEPRIAPKIIDTSVIIDGRIHDVIEAGFLDGRIMVPQFVLSELQQVADSSDSLKRARGRKGLEILQAMKGLPSVQIEITQEAIPEIREVDLKLIELARRTGGKLVTNDFNLNKVARVRDIPVLNINDLANALKPVVLPGEPMRVFVLKTGKEAGQGVAYLDDGTMVVVDDGRDHVGKNVDILVTSVLQTTAGKMFFGRMVAPETLTDEEGAR
ncbi:MAG: PIN domain-containing protein [Acidobacteria bacterium]|nr:PIN domain-containing protein [Acidobacteriota bacterium]